MQRAKPRSDPDDGRDPHRRDHRDRRPRRGRDPARARPPRRTRHPERRLLGCAHAARGRELPDHWRADRALPRARQGAGHGQAGGGARQPQARPSAARQVRGDRAGLRGDHHGRAPRPVRGRRDPGRGRHLDQHERERGDRQPGARAHRPRQGRLRGAAPEQRRQHGAVDQRRLPDGAQARGHPGERAAAPGARGAGLRAEGQGRRVRRRAQDGPHPAPGRGADDAWARSSTPSTPP